MGDMQVSGVVDTPQDLSGLPVEKANESPVKKSKSKPEVAEGTEFENIKPGTRVLPDGTIREDY